MTTSKLEEIKKSIFQRMQDGNHDISHLERIAENAMHFATILGIAQNIDANLLQAICYLHDVIYIRHKDTLYSYLFEKMLVRKELIQILPEFKIENSEAKIIISACTQHPYSFPFKRLNKTGDMYTKLLQDSDTIDFFNNRRAKVVKSKINKIPLFGAFLSSLIDVLILYGKKNIRTFLNFPELSKKISI